MVQFGNNIITSYSVLKFLRNSTSVVNATATTIVFSTMFVVWLMVMGLLALDVMEWRGQDWFLLHYYHFFTAQKVLDECLQCNGTNDCYGCDGVVCARCFFE